MLVTKLRQVKPSSRKDKLCVPNIRIPISVQKRTLTCAGLRLREKPDSNHSGMAETTAATALFGLSGPQQKCSDMAFAGAAPGSAAI